MGEEFKEEEEEEEYTLTENYIRGEEKEVGEEIEMEEEYALT